MRLRLLALLLVMTAPAAATTLDSLMAEDKLRLRAWLGPEGDLVVGQEVRLTIEIATPRWFAGGTRIKAPEVPNLVVLRRNDFATNLSRRENGATWVLQQWQLELYPQRPGRYTIPPVALELAVNDAEAGIVRGTLMTPALEFETSIPAALEALDEWFATPEFSVSQTFDRSLDGLTAGDAFTRTIELRATNLTAMMLPEPQVQELEGLPAYPALPELEDRSNRGEATAIRRQSISHVVERAGNYRLPAQTWYWWNTDTGQVESTTLAAVEVNAGGVVAAETAESREPFSVPWRIIAIAGAAALALLLLGKLAHRRRARPERLLLRAERALRSGSAKQAAALVYTWLNTQPAGADWLSLRKTAAVHGGGDLSEAVEGLLRAAYSGERKPEEAGADTSAFLRKLKQSVRDHKRGQATAIGGALNPVQPRK